MKACRRRLQPAIAAHGHHLQWMLLWYARCTLAAWHLLRQLHRVLRYKCWWLLRAAVRGWRATRLFALCCQEWLASQHALQAPAGNILLRLRRLLT